MRNPITVHVQIAAEVDARLQEIMHSIHPTCVEHGTRDNGYISYVAGANIGGFLKIPDAMVAYGAV